MIKENKSQEKAIQTINGPVIIISCPGSGKTTTLLRRIKSMVDSGIKETNILMVTFTKAAATEMDTRYKNVYGSNTGGITFCTIHSLCLGILRAEKLYDISDIMDEEQKKEFIFHFLRRQPKVEDAWEMTSDVIGEISKVKNSYINVRKYDPEKCQKDLFLKVFRAYETWREKEHKLDFEDMMLECKGFLENNPEALARWQNKFQYIQCDEYQDTNLVQRDILYLLAGKNKNLCVVGDDDQSIYHFRGAQPSIMLDFKKDFPNATVIKMSTNYRSSQVIVDCADMLIKTNKLRFKKDFISDRGAEGSEGTFTYARCNSKEEQMKVVIKGIQEAVDRGVPYKDIAILFRTNKQAQSPMDDLMEAGIPFYCTEKIKSVYDEWIFKVIKTYVKLSCGYGTEQDIMYVLNRPNRYLKAQHFKGCVYTMESLLERVSYIETDWQADQAKDNIIKWFSVIGKGKFNLMSDPVSCISAVKKLGLIEYIKEYCIMRNLAEEDYTKQLIKLQEDAAKFPTVDAWLRYAKKESARVSSLNKNKNADGVQLTTMHKSKGREWNTVFLVDVNHGIVPHKSSVDIEGGLEEEKRILYVAMTRAKDYLYVLSSSVESVFMEKLMEKVRKEKIKKQYPMPELGQLYLHKKLGMGIVSDIAGSKITLDFGGEEKKFIYPDAVEKGTLKKA